MMMFSRMIVAYTDVANLRTGPGNDIKREMTLYFMFLNNPPTRKGI